MDEQSRTRRRIARAARLGAYQHQRHERQAHETRLRTALRKQQRRRQVDWVAKAEAVEPVYQADPVLPEVEASRRSAATLAAYLAAWASVAGETELAEAALGAAEELAGLPPVE